MSYGQKFINQHDKMTGHNNKEKTKYCPTQDKAAYMQCCCPREKSLSSRILEDQFSSPCPCPWGSSPCPCPRTTSPCPCPRPRQFKSSKIVKDCVDYKTSCMHSLRFSAHQRLRPLLNACSAPVDCSCCHTVHAWATNCWVSWWL